MNLFFSQIAQRFYIFRNSACQLAILIVDMKSEKIQCQFYLRLYVKIKIQILNIIQKSGLPSCKTRAQAKHHDCMRFKRTFLLFKEQLFYHFYCCLLRKKTKIFHSHEFCQRIFLFMRPWSNFKLTLKKSRIRQIEKENNFWNKIILMRFDLLRFHNNRCGPQI